jgi:hypothetical protein
LRKIRLYRNSDSVDVMDTDMFAPLQMSEATERAFDELVDAGLSSGTSSRVLVRQPLTDGGFSLVRVSIKQNFPLARHSHVGDCLYYIESGSAILGNVTLEAGDSFFVPSGASYGYSAGSEGAEVLEFRFGIEGSIESKAMDESPGRCKALADIMRANRQRWEADLTGEVRPAFERA